jgi:hypothetical protein
MSEIEAKINVASKLIEQALTRASAPIICWSGGKDSQLVLDLVHEQDPTIPVLIYKDFFPRDHMKWIGKVITEKGLVAFSYGPSVIECKGNSIISRYPFSAGSIPVISDVIHSDECGLDWGKRVLNRTPLQTFPWDIVFTGSRKSDSHPLVPKLNFENTIISTPIWNLTDSEVWEEIKTRNIQTSDTSSDAHICTRCLETDRVVFCPKLQRNIQSIN